MPLIYSTKAATVPNPCMECGEHCKRPKRFCSDSHKELWLKGRGIVLDARGVAQIADERRFRGNTADAREFRRKLHLQQPF